MISYSKIYNFPIKNHGKLRNNLNEYVKRNRIANLFTHSIQISLFRNGKKSTLSYAKHTTTLGYTPDTIRDDYFYTPHHHRTYARCMNNSIENRRRQTQIRIYKVHQTASAEPTRGPDEFIDHEAETTCIPAYGCTSKIAHAFYNWRQVHVRT